MTGKQKILALLVCVGIFIGGGLAVVGLQWLLAPPEASQYVTLYKDWRLTCLPAGKARFTCGLTQDIVTKSGQTIVRLAMGSGRTEGRIVVTVPHQVLLQPGLGLSIGKAKVLAARYDTCDRVGCMGSIPIDSTLQEAINDNDEGQVVFVGLDNKPILLRYSLRGFGAGRAALNKANAKQNLWWGFLVR